MVNKILYMQYRCTHKHQILPLNNYILHSSSSPHHHPLSRWNKYTCKTEKRWRKIFHLRVRKSHNYYVTGIEILSNFRRELIRKIWKLSQISLPYSTLSHQVCITEIASLPYSQFCIRVRKNPTSHAFYFTYVTGSCESKTISEMSKFRLVEKWNVCIQSFRLIMLCMIVPKFCLQKETFSQQISFCFKLISMIWVKLNTLKSSCQLHNFLKETYKKISQAISRITGPNIGMFVFILLHFPDSKYGHEM